MRPKRPRSKPLIAGALAGSLLLSGCAGRDPNDVAGALLVGAAVVGLGVLAVAVSDDDDDHGYRRHSHRERHRHAYAGRCDSRDCYRHGDGRGRR